GGDAAAAGRAEPHAAGGWASPALRSRLRAIRARPANIGTGAAGDRLGPPVAARLPARRHVSGFSRSRAEPGPRYTRRCHERASDRVARLRRPNAAADGWTRAAA